MFKYDARLHSRIGCETGPTEWGRLARETFDRQRGAHRRGQLHRLLSGVVNKLDTKADRRMMP